MRERAVLHFPKALARRVALSIDLVLLTARGRRLMVLLRHGGEARTRTSEMLPWDGLKEGELLDDAAQRIARSVLGLSRTRVEQIGAFGDTARHPGDAELSIGFLGLVPAGEGTLRDDGASWYELGALPDIAPRQHAVVDAALRTIRVRLDYSPLAFRLLPSAFTLSELQGMYELLLGRPLHKASFRRALQGALLVEPLDEWRSEGRGRPAQLFRYAPRRRRGARRGLRFDFPVG